MGRDCEYCLRHYHGHRFYNGYAFKVDSYTGSSFLTKLAPVTGIQEMALNEAVNKANISHYMLARESYDWEIIGRRDWYVVNAMSSKNVATAYARQFDATNPASPDILFGRNKSVRIKIKSLVLSAKDDKGRYTLATVRFDKFLINRNDDRVEDTKSMVATLNFEYISSLAFEEKYRVENPIGFVVNSYRVDPEYSTPSAAAVNQSVQQASEKGAKQ